MKTTLKNEYIIKMGGFFIVLIKIQKHILFCRCDVFSSAKEMTIKVDKRSIRFNILDVLRVKFLSLFVRGFSRQRSEQIA